LNVADKSKFAFGDTLKIGSSTIRKISGLIMPDSGNLVIDSAMTTDEAVGTCVEKVVGQALDVLHKVADTGQPGEVKAAIEQTGNNPKKSLGLPIGVWIGIAAVCCCCMCLSVCFYFMMGNRTKSRGMAVYPYGAQGAMDPGPTLAPGSYNYAQLPTQNAMYPGAYVA
jgi:hypothetical protein